MAQEKKQQTKSMSGLSMTSHDKKNKTAAPMLGENGLFIHGLRVDEKIHTSTFTTCQNIP